MITLDPTRLRPWVGDPPRTTVPDVPGYSQIAHEKLSLGVGTIVGLVLIPVWWILFAAVIGLLGGPDEIILSIDLPRLLLGLFIILVAVPVLHEIVHGVAATVFGVRPSYGIGPGFAYTTFLDPLRKIPYLFVGLAPLVVLSVACILIATFSERMASVVLVFAVINASGAIGDLWMSWRILRQPRDAIFYDLADGFAVLTPDH